jgi:anhydro-N-acetylmuramic acid kinase
MTSTPSAPEDIQNTLTELSARSIANTVKDLATRCDKPLRSAFICGGGARNGYLMERLGKFLEPIELQTTEALGIHPQMVEGAAFAWLAMQTVKHKPGNCPLATGAQRPKILGGIFLAS